MGRGVSLVREQTEKVFHRDKECVRLRITAQDEILMPRHIFGHQQRVMDPRTEATGDEFAFIISPFDQAIYPIDEPDPLQYPGYFRKDTIDILLPGLIELEATWQEIVRQVNTLILAYNKLDTMIEMETVRCGDDPPTSESESESESS